MSDETEANPCVRCGAECGEDYDWIRGPLHESSRRHCQACAIALWDCSVFFVFHLDVPDAVRARLQSFDMLRRLQRWFRDTKPFAVHVFHRRETETVEWLALWDSYRNGGRPTEPYSYRAWCSGLEIILLYDETETLDSLEWVCLHELGHHACNQSRMFDEAMSKENVNEGRTSYEWKDDAGHEADSEERLVNRIATSHMGGQERARPWWRPRVTAFKRGDAVLPDAFAPEDSLEFAAFCRAVAEGWASPLPIHGLDMEKVRARLPLPISEIAA